MKMKGTEVPASLVDLPDPCLLAVLRCLADEPVSMFSAARAHSRLHQAAVVVLSRIRASVKNQQQLDNGLLPYMGKHGQHVDSLAVRCDWGTPPSLRQLPTSLQLTSLQLEGVSVQLQPDLAFQGVLRPGLPLKQLQLGVSCTLLDEKDGLAAALHGLPALEHLRVSVSNQRIAMHVLQALHQPTYLHLYCRYGGACETGGTFLQPLQELTSLRHLRVGGHFNHRFTADMLSALCSLTHLELTQATLDPAALAGKKQLQHLQLPYCCMAGGVAGVTQLLSQLQLLTQLTHLDLSGCVRDHQVEVGSPPAAAFSALTASSKLQHLSIYGCTLPAGGWQHVFPAGRQLQVLQSLVLDSVTVGESTTGMGPNGGRTAGTAGIGGSLVSCCPGLQAAQMRYMQCSKELLGALQGLSRLTMLWMGDVVGVSNGQEVHEPLCRLTGLRDLQLTVHCRPQGLLLLTRLKQLTRFANLDPTTGCTFISIKVRIPYASYEAHVGGMLCAVLSCIFVLRTAWTPMKDSKHSNLTLH
jgi:hypothetical protein